MKLLTQTIYGYEALSTIIPSDVFLGSLFNTSSAYPPTYHTIDYSGGNYKYFSVSRLNKDYAYLYDSKILGYRSRGSDKDLWIFRLLKEETEMHFYRWPYDQGISAASPLEATTINFPSGLSVPWSELDTKYNEFGTYPFSAITNLNNDKVYTFIAKDETNEARIKLTKNFTNIFDLAVAQHKEGRPGIDGIRVNRYHGDSINASVNASDAGAQIYVTTSYTNVDVTNNRINATNSFNNNDVVKYTSTGNAIGGLTNGNTYRISEALLDPPVINTVTSAYDAEGSLSPNTPYYVGITACNSFGETTVSGLGLKILGSSDNCLNVTWYSQSGVTSYKVYAYTNTSVKYIGSTTGTSYSILALNPSGASPPTTNTTRTGYFKLNNTTITSQGSGNHTFSKGLPSGTYYITVVPYYGRDGVDGPYGVRYYYDNPSLPYKSITISANHAINVTWNSITNPYSGHENTQYDVIITKSTEYPWKMYSITANTSCTINVYSDSQIYCYSLPNHTQEVEEVWAFCETTAQNSLINSSEGSGSGPSCYVFIGTWDVDSTDNISVYTEYPDYNISLNSEVSYTFGGDLDVSFTQESPNLRTENIIKRFESDGTYIYMLAGYLNANYDTGSSTLESKIYKLTSTFDLEGEFNLPANVTSLMCTPNDTYCYYINSNGTQLIYYKNSENFSVEHTLNLPDNYDRFVSAAILSKTGDYFLVVLKPTLNGPYVFAMAAIDSSSFIICAADISPSIETKFENDPFDSSGVWFLYNNPIVTPAADRIGYLSIPKVTTNGFFFYF